jgi:hypothetical protein
MAHPYAVTIAVLASLTVSVSPTRSDEYPALNVAPICHGITNQSDLQEGLRKVSFDQCLQAEQVDRETMVKEWFTFSADDKRHCIALATTGASRAIRSCSPVWKWRAMCESCTDKLATRPPRFSRDSRRRRVIASRHHDSA